MKVIVAHSSPDYDALASMALAGLLHPDAVKVVLGGVDESVSALLNLFEDTLELHTPEDIELNEVEELIVVDTSSPGRIAPFDALLGKVPVTLYDHHPRDEGAIEAGRGLWRELGATASLLTLLLDTRDISIPAPVASLALLGIHGDTGDLRFGNTRADDHKAAALLLEAGASLELLERFGGERYTEAQRELLGELLDAAQETEVIGHRVVTSRAEREGFVAGLAPLVGQLLELHNADAALVSARMDGKTFVIARATRAFDVGAALNEAFGGGGHAGAGFARSEVGVDETEQLALAALARHGQAHLQARDLMSFPVKTVSAAASVAEARALLLRYGHNGLPVLDEEGRVSGVISRRTLDKAVQHGLANAPVKGFLAREPITARPDTSLSDLETLIKTHNVGRIPILAADAAGNEKLVGIVTRSDLIGLRHSPPSTSLSPSQTLARDVLERLPQAARSALEAVKDGLEGPLYLVGGTVRDALLGVGMQDLDLVVTGDVQGLGLKLKEVLGGELNCHADFGTCTLALPSGLVVDLATSRDEYYTHPGALPSVTPGTIYRDLSRRDFTVNALALRVKPAPADLVDPFGGLKDVEARLLRTLHPLSFVEDPTRLLRGARLAARLNLSFDGATRAQVASALRETVLAQVSPARLRAELELTLAEGRVAPALAQLSDLGTLEAMFGFNANNTLLEALDTLRREEIVPAEAYLLALLLDTPAEDLEPLLTRFHWPRRYLEVLKRLRRVHTEDDVTDEELGTMGAAEHALVSAFSRTLAARVERFRARSSERKLRGQDVLDLGLLPGPGVGDILREVAQARHAGHLSGFEDELAMAKKLVRAALQE